MPPRPNRRAALYVEMSADEVAVLERMAGSTTTLPNMVRVALWSLGDHMGIEMPDGVFDLRHQTGRPKGSTTPNPKIRQHEPPKPSGRPQKRSHPWRDSGAPMQLSLSPNGARHE